MVEENNPQQIPAIHWKTIAETNNVMAPFFSQEWHTLWFEIFGKTVKPFTLQVNKSVIAPLARQEKIVTFSGGKEIADYLDIIGPSDDKTESWKEIISYCQRQGIKKIELFNIPETSETLTFFKWLGARNTSVQIGKEDTTPIITIPETWEDYLTMLGQHNRHELRRKIRNFESQFGAMPLSVSEHPTENSEDLIRLMSLNHDKAQFLTPDMQTFFRKLPIVFTDKILLFYLTYRNEIIAMALVFRENENLLLYNSGFNQKKFSGAGFYIKAKTIQWAIDHKLKKYNFLQGKEMYKYDLGAKDFLVYSVSARL